MSTIVQFSDTPQGDLLLLELDEDSLQLLESTNKNNDPPCLILRGHDDETAVICNSTTTFNLRQSETSNTILLGRRIPSINKDGEETTMVTVDAMFQKQVELEKTGPKLDRLREMVYVGAVKEGSWKSAEGADWEEVLEVVQASDGEIRDEIVKLGLLLYEGRLVPIRTQFLVEFIRGVSAILQENDMSIDRVKFSVLDDVGLGDLFDHVPKPVLAHCLEMISENVSEDDMMEEDGELRLSEEKVCRVIGEELLKTSEDSWSLEGFMDIFVTSIPELFKPRLEHLSGLYIIDHGPDSRANIIYFPKTSLPMNPKDRLEQMFEQKRKWTEEEMMPYVDDLGKGNRADLEVVLLKHSRTFKVGGMTYYASKAR